MAKGFFAVFRHGGLLGFGAPGQPRSLAGQAHGRTIPMAQARSARYIGLLCAYSPTLIIVRAQPAKI